MKRFTDEEITELLYNPHVVSVDRDNIHFSYRCMVTYLSLLKDEGFTPHKALRILGFVPSIFGEERIASFKKRFEGEVRVIKNRSLYRCNGKRYSCFSCIEDELDYYQRLSNRLARTIKLELNRQLAEGNNKK